MPTETPCHSPMELCAVLRLSHTIGMVPVWQSSPAHDISEIDGDGRGGARGGRPTRFFPFSPRNFFAPRIPTGHVISESCPRAGGVRVGSLARARARARAWEPTRVFKIFLDPFPGDFVWGSATWARAHRGGAPA